MVGPLREGYPDLSGSTTEKKLFWFVSSLSPLSGYYLLFFVVLWITIDDDLPALFLNETVCEEEDIYNYVLQNIIICSPKGRHTTNVVFLVVRPSRPSYG